jgi:uncharacterized protein with PIN domain
MYDRLAAGYRFRLRVFLDLAGESEPTERAARMVAEALLRRGAEPALVTRELLTESRSWRERARHASRAAGAASLRVALRRRAEAKGGALAEPPVFFCDASLAALGRWLRAAGYEAHTRPSARGLGLVADAARAMGILLTTDHRCLEFAAVRDGRLPTIWLPSNEACEELLQLVVADLDLDRQPSRCMVCGGLLTSVEKESVRERIPPRTALWRDVYFVCLKCGRLYWQGTHWEKIERELERVFGRTPRAWESGGPRTNAG